MKIIRVALDVPINTLFDYRCDEASAIDIGLRVLVPFGPRRVIGVIMQVSNHSDISQDRLKVVSRIYRDDTPLPADLLDLFQFCNQYYHHAVGEIVLNALPTGLRKARPIRRRGTINFYRFTSSGRQLTLESLPTRAIVKRKLWQALLEHESCSAEALAALSSGFKKVITEWISLGWVSEREQPRPPQQDEVLSKPIPQPNPEQQAAIAALEKQLGAFQVSLLHGITGSGKTEVYLHLIAKVMAQGGQVLVLVPEINLTPQLEETFRARFPLACLVTLHSALHESERTNNWLLAQSGAANIVLGTRLAVFTPLPQLALVIVDEEHDSSFKQQESFRYSARDLAIARAKQNNIPILLGSATPALESYYKALTGRYRLLELNQRAVHNAALPVIHCLDTRHEKLIEGLSNPLIGALKQRLRLGEQSLVFINRRGYAPVLLCGECGWSAGCARCSSRQVVHLREKQLRCHHCGHSERIPTACPACGNQDLKVAGHGTQRVEDALTRLLPTARILRIDRDSTRRKEAWQAILKQVRAGEVDILVGTQMLAKGHDFPNVTLVGILDADSALYSSDFRASERLFAQLLQVSGRAGRAALPGEVLIQTQFPDHALFDSLRRHDYNGYAATLLKERAQAGFPPFVHQALLRAEAPKLKTALNFLAHALELARPLPYQVMLYDPVEAYMMRHSGKERAHLLVQSASRKALQSFLTEWLAALRSGRSGTVRWSLDVDPTDF